MHPTPLHPTDDTIVALSTPLGRGAIGLVRLSGPESLKIARSVFRARGRARIRHAHSAFGTILSRDDSGEIDSGYLTYYRAGRSYTGEDVVELTCHGSPIVIERILEELIRSGARAARPGEFTYRAVLNGRLDLAQAEGVRDLIDATTADAARVARDQIRGGLSRRIGTLKDALVEIISRGEAAVEFAEEPDVAEGPGRTHLERRLDTLTADLEALLATWRRGRLLKEGATVVIAGRPNAGKSSLFNRLLQRDRAIVAPLPGTTRDYLTECLDLAGIPVSLVDTAGLRETGEAIESQGVAMTRRLTGQADLVLVLVACDDHVTAEDDAFIASLARAPVVVASKSDLRNGHPLPSPGGHDPIAVSAKTGDGVDALFSRIVSRLADAPALSHGEAIVCDVRHQQALSHCHERLKAARAAAATGVSEEIFLVDLYAALRHLEEITGTVTMDAIHERIFSTFCVGK